MPTYHIFTGEGWNGTAAAVDLGTLTTVLGTGTHIAYPTFDKAVAGADAAVTASGSTDAADNVVAPCPYINSTYPGFVDSTTGALKSRVVVTLENCVVVTNPITVCGGAYRLRLDGINNDNGTRERFVATNGKGIVFEDVEFVNMYRNSSLFSFNTAITFRRCLFANLRVKGLTYWYGKNGNSFADCAFIGLRKPDGSSVGVDTALFATRCACYSLPITNFSPTDCVVDATGAAFVKAFPDANGNPTAAADVTDWTDWEDNVDLRLKPTAPTWTETRATEETDVAGTTTENVTINGQSVVKTTAATLDADAGTTTLVYTLSTNPYLTGNGLTSADLPVYDLAGNRRKAGGAVGAYEYYDADDYDGVLYLPYDNWRYYKIENASDGPQISDFMIFARLDGEHIRSMYHIDFDSATPYQLQIGYNNAGSYTSINAGNAGITYLEYYGRRDWNPDSIQLRFINDGTVVGGVSKVTLSATKGTDFLPNPSFKERRLWRTSASTVTLMSGAPSSSSTLRVDRTVEFRSDASTVGTVIVDGWTRPDLGDAEIGTVVFGKGSSVTSSGKLTLTGETNTDAAIWAKITPKSGLRLTLDDCATSDAS